jgi:hypothetical protein
MPRKRQTQKPVTAGLEAGASYGQVGENLTVQDPAQGGVPLPQTRGPSPTPPGAAPAPSGAGPVPPPGGAGELPLEAAQGFNPGLTPLTAPGAGLQQRGGPPPMADNKERAARLLETWAASSQDPAMARAAAQLRMRGNA